MNAIPVWVLLLFAVGSIVASFSAGAALRLLVDRWRERHPPVRKGPPRDPW